MGICTGPEAIWVYALDWRPYAYGYMHLNSSSPYWNGLEAMDSI